MTLPAHRQAITGRTQSRTYYAGDFDPIERHPVSRAERIYGVLLATVIGICLAAALVHFWSS